MKIVPFHESLRRRLNDTKSMTILLTGTLFVIFLAMNQRRSFAQTMEAGRQDSTSAIRVETPSPSIDDLIQQALERSPSISALRARLVASGKMAHVPGLPNPSFEVMSQDAEFPKWTVGKMEMSMVQVGVTQSFPPLGRTSAQKAVGEAEAGVRAIELEAAQREVIAQVRTLYGRLYALDREAEALGDGAHLLEALSRTALARYGANRSELEAVLKARLSASRLSERRNDLDAERAGAVAALNQLLDRPGEDPVGLVRSLPEIEVPDAGWDTLALTHSSDVQVRRTEVAAAERRVRLARTGAWPGFMAGSDVGLRGRLDPVVTIRLGIDLPLWEARRSRFEVQAAESELSMARDEQRQAEAMARSKAARLDAEWRRSAEQVRLYQESLVPQARAVLDAAQSSFLADRIDFSTVIEDFQLWLETRAQLAAREAERFSTWAELESLISAQIP